MAFNEREYWLALTLAGCTQLDIIIALRQRFGSLAQAWSASEPELIQAGLTPKPARRLVEKRSKIDLVSELTRLTRFDCRFVTADEGEYPALLKQIYAPPTLLYYRGNLTSASGNFLGVVGTRKTSLYGRRSTQQLVSQLAGSGLTIVSGLALGIDTVAHQAALDNKLRTWAVLGCGLDQIYPTENRHVAEAIIKSSGLILSEYPLGSEPLRHHFPARNRIISGLSQAVLVVEAPEHSGALITAQFALEQNRDVLAVPGDMFSPNAYGPNRLIKQGARPVTGAEDIWESYRATGNYRPAIQTGHARKPPPVPANPDEAVILELLAQQPLSVDQISDQCKLGISVINSTLTFLEVSGKIRPVGPDVYTLNI
ncbi:MAG: DNA-processing protein DprA [Patescibacteria group bacterium]|jgi:DNA processing protein